MFYAYLYCIMFLIALFVTWLNGSQKRLETYIISEIDNETWYPKYVNYIDLVSGIGLLFTTGLLVTLLDTQPSPDSKATTYSAIVIVLGSVMGWLLGRLANAHVNNKIKGE